MLLDPRVEFPIRRVRHQVGKLDEVVLLRTSGYRVVDQVCQWGTQEPRTESTASATRAPRPTRKRAHSLLLTFVMEDHKWVLRGAEVLQALEKECPSMVERRAWVSRHLALVDDYGECLEPAELDELERFSVDRVSNGSIMGARRKCALRVNEVVRFKFVAGGEIPSRLDGASPCDGCIKGRLPLGELNYYASEGECVRANERRVGVSRIVGVCNRHCRLPRQPPQFGPGARWRFALILPRTCVRFHGLTWHRCALNAADRDTVPRAVESAAAWRKHLEAAMPRVGAGTVRNQFAVGEDFVPAMRTRTSWVFGPLHLLDPASLTIIQSGVSWVLKMTTPAAVPSYLIAIEVEEKWPIRSWPKIATDPAPSVNGPSIKVCLAQTGIGMSAAFDWEYLYALWWTMGKAGSDWAETPARPQADYDR